MKRFFVSILTVTVFCVGLGAIVEKAGARFKSDEKALALIKQARIAIGGDQALAEVRSMVITGNATHTFKIGSETRTETGEIEIAMQLPDKLSKMVKIGKHDGAVGSEDVVKEKHDIIIMRGEGKGEGAGLGVGDGKKVVVRKVDGPENGEVEKIIASGKDGEFTTADGKKVIVRRTNDGPSKTADVIVTGKDGEWKTSDGQKVVVRRMDGEKHGDLSGADGKKVIVREGNGDGKEIEKVIVRGDGPAHFKAVAASHHNERQNELLRTTLSLLLSAPEGMDVSYTLGGEGDVDGNACNIVNASFGGQTYKL
ncbi:MAG TPA: hypothetical protein VNA22_06355, partial [Pyrinomonadaceae bacterium]|nr:hypothetical protein [Pyrinomonadaceae bacterium]